MYRMQGMPDSMQGMESASCCKNKNTGSSENPPDLTPNLYNKIRYVEMPSDANPVRWLFVSQRCMHCDDAGCIKICPAPGALFKTKEGTVGFDKEKCIGCKLCVAGALSTFRDTMKKTRLQSVTFALTE